MNKENFIEKLVSIGTFRQGIKNFKKKEDSSEF